jgi:hypothetical protein
VLKSFEIMDYSLLIGVHNIDRALREQGPTGDDEQPCSSRTDSVPTPPGQ